MNILVTGAGGGLGNAITMKFLEDGNEVYCITSKNSLFEKQYQNLHIVGCDLLSQESTLAAIKKIRDITFQKVFICHGGASLDSNDPLAVSSTLEKVFRLNFFSAVQIFEGIVSNLACNSTACFVSSISGVESHGGPAYSAAKASLIAYSRSIGRLLSKRNIAVFSVSPGAFNVDGGYWENVAINNPKHYNDFISSRMAIGRLGNVIEVSNFIVGISDIVTPYVCGNNFIYDGGQGRKF